MEFYQSDEQLKRTIWRLMQAHTGFDRRVTREELVHRVQRLMSTSDRQVRDALSELPIVWDDGYFIPRTRTEADGYIAGMRSRQAAIASKIRIIDDYLRSESEPVKVEQMSWMELA